MYQLFDVFIHVPIDKEVEAFGQIYVEALAAGIPSIFTLSGVASEFIKHEHNALVVEYENENDIYNALIRLIQNQSIREKLITNGKIASERFNLNKMISKLEELYDH